MKTKSSSLNIEIKESIKTFSNNGKQFVASTPAVNEWLKEVIQSGRKTKEILELHQGIRNMVNKNMGKYNIFFMHLSFSKLYLMMKERWLDMILKI